MRPLGPSRYKTETKSDWCHVCGCRRRIAFAGLTGRIFDGRKLCDAGKDSHKHVRKWRLEPLCAEDAGTLEGGAA